MAEGKPQEALARLQEAVRISALAMGERHPRRGQLLKNLAIVAEQLGLLQKAEAHYQEALMVLQEAWGADDPRSQECRLTLEAFLAAQRPDSDAASP